MVSDMTHYLIDIRLMGSVKHQIRPLSNHLAEKFNPGKNLVVPHITLAGPFSTSDEQKLIEDFTKVCTNQTAIPKYEVGGYGFFDDTRVVFVTITPDENFKTIPVPAWHRQSPRIAHCETMIWILLTHSNSMRRSP